MSANKYRFTQPDAVENGISGPATPMKEEDRERERYKKKAELLRRALIEADEMDKTMGL